MKRQEGKNANKGDCFFHREEHTVQDYRVERRDEFTVRMLEDIMIRLTYPTHCVWIFTKLNKYVFIRVSS